MLYRKEGNVYSGTTDLQMLQALCSEIKQKIDIDYRFATMIKQIDKAHDHLLYELKSQLVQIRDKNSWYQNLNHPYPIQVQASTEQMRNNLRHGIQVYNQRCNNLIRMIEAQSSVDTTESFCFVDHDHVVKLLRDVISGEIWYGMHDDFLEQAELVMIKYQPLGVKSLLVKISEMLYNAYEEVYQREIVNIVTNAMKASEQSDRNTKDSN